MWSVFWEKCNCWFFTECAGVVVQGSFVAPGESSLESAVWAEGWVGNIEFCVEAVVLRGDFEGGGAGFAGFGLGHLAWVIIMRNCVFVWVAGDFHWEEFAVFFCFVHMVDKFGA